MGALVFFVLLFGSRFELIKTYSFFDQVRSAKIKTMEAFLSNSADVDMATRETIRDVWTAYQFKAATGMYAEGKRRAALIAFYNTLEAAASWELIRRAQPFLVLKENSISIKALSWSAKLERCWYVGLLVVALVMTLVCVVATAILFYTTNNVLSTASDYSGLVLRICAHRRVLAAPV